MKDTEISKRFGIPISTLSDWKKRDQRNWRYKLYWFIKEKLAKEKTETIEWIVFRDGAKWTDRLKNEAECLYHIQGCVEEDELFDEDDYTYRQMTREEINEYHKG